jgi:gamma-glutamylcyclotransferase (GGCT)/AIG2-like uncharacterized protein YtfP
MKRVNLLLLLCVLSILIYAEDKKKFGESITIKEISPVSKILEKPEEFVAKKILVEGRIIDVCEDKGCWLEISSDKKFQTLKCYGKQNGISFPADIKGKKAKIQGEIYKVELTKEKAIEYFKHQAEHKKEEFDSTKITGPTTLYFLKVFGAEIE